MTFYSGQLPWGSPRQAREIAKTAVFQPFLRPFSTVLPLATAPQYQLPSLIMPFCNFYFRFYFSHFRYFGRRTAHLWFALQLPACSGRNACAHRATRMVVAMLQPLYLFDRAASWAKTSLVLTGSALVNSARQLCIFRGPRTFHVIERPLLLMV